MSGICTSVAVIRTPPRLRGQDASVRASSREGGRFASLAPSARSGGCCAVPSVAAAFAKRYGTGGFGDCGDDSAAGSAAQPLRWPAMLRLTLLGPPAITRDGRTLAFDTRKATALLAFLALEGKPQPRDRLPPPLWPDADPSRARSALRRTVSVTAAQVGGALETERAHLALRDGAWWCDAVEFRTLTSRRDAAADRQAADLYPDDFLAGFSLRDAPGFDDWQAAVGDDLRRRLTQVLARQADRAVADGDLDRALATAQRWLSLDPLHEPAHRMLMQLHAWRGDRAAAIRQYRTCARTLDDELGVAPLDEAAGLDDAVRRNVVPPPELRPDVPADTTTAAATPRRLVGRD